MADKGLNLFDECAAGCVNLCIQEEECISSSWRGGKMCTPGTMGVPANIFQGGGRQFARLPRKLPDLFCNW